MHFGEGERLFYGQVQDAAVPIRLALAKHPEPDSPRAAQPALEDAPPSPRKPHCPRLYTETFTQLRSSVCRGRASCFLPKQPTGGQQVLCAAPCRLLPDSRKNRGSTKQPLCCLIDGWGAGSQSAWQQRRQAHAARKAEEAAGTAVLQLRRCLSAEYPALA